MSEKKTLTFAIMDAPYESARTTTVFRLMDIAARRGYNINVFAYEGAVCVPFVKQKPHAKMPSTGGMKRKKIIPYPRTGLSRLLTPHKPMVAVSTG